MTSDETDSPPAATLTASPGNPPWTAVLASAVGLAGLLLVIGHAWVAEDAFITFRVVDNAVTGHGLRWNVDERVQAYTNPLWLFLHLPLRVLSKNLFLLTMVAGVLLTAAAVILVLRIARREPLSAAVLLLLPLALSKSFVEFATSGLETSLSFALYALFAWLLFRKDDREPSWFNLAQLTALAGINRLDSLLLYFPFWVWIVLRRPRNVPLRLILAGFWPLYLWETFSLLYYGFPFPNTAYAKLGGGISRLVYWRQGLFYLIDFIRRDLPAFVVLAGLVGWATGELLRRRPERNTLRTSAAWLGIGVAVYALYVISVGGDFMTGRLWSVPFFAALVLAQVAWPVVDRRRLIYVAAALLAAKAVTFVTEPRLQMVGGRPGRVDHGITDERLWYSEGHAFFTTHRKDRFRFASPPLPPEPKKIVLWYAVGLKPYRSGPNMIVVDGLGLADPLLARLPAIPNQPFLIGHIKRDVPAGYLESRVYGIYEWMQPDLRAYYEKLRLIVSGPLLSFERLRTIVLFNLGTYDHYRKAYVASGTPPAPVKNGEAFVKLPPAEVEKMLQQRRAARDSIMRLPAPGETTWPPIPAPPDTTPSR